MDKMSYPKCPYCGSTYHGNRSGEYALVDLATKGWVTEQKVKCHECGADFRVTVKIMYYGSKIRDE